MDFQNWLEEKRQPNPNTTLDDWLGPRIDETVSTTRYSVDVNYRSKIEDAMEAFAKIVLGYVSAAVKQNGYHVKHLFEQKPLRIFVSSRHWDDGEWVGVVYFDPKEKCFMIAKGYYNKMHRLVNGQGHSKKCAGTSAAEVTKEVRNFMHQLKSEPDRRIEKLKPAPLKRGPK